MAYKQRTKHRTDDKGQTQQQERQAEGRNTWAKKLQELRVNENMVTVQLNMYADDGRLDTSNTDLTSLKGRI